MVQEFLLKVFLSLVVHFRIRLCRLPKLSCKNHQCYKYLSLHLKKNGWFRFCHDERDSESVYANTWMLNHVQYAKAKSTVFTDRAFYFTGPFQFLNFPAKESKSLVFTVTELPEIS